MFKQCFLFLFEKIKENQRILQEKTDMLNQLRLFNEELERKLNERDTIIDNLNDQIKVLESQVGEKSKSSETYEKVILNFFFIVSYYVKIFNFFCSIQETYSIEQ